MKRNTINHICIWIIQKKTLQINVWAEWMNTDPYHIFLPTDKSWEPGENLTISCVPVSEILMLALLY